MKKLLPLTLFFTLSTCSGMNVIGQMMIDAGEMMADAGNGNAQTAQKTVTAATDLTRLEQGITVLSITTGAQLVAGPFVVTALTKSSGSTATVFFVSDPATCDTPVAPGFEVREELKDFFVKPGQKLCAIGSASTVAAALWSGYRPY